MPGAKKQMELKKKDAVPCRFVLTLLVFCGMSLVFGHRACLSVALVAMANNGSSGAGFEPPPDLMDHPDNDTAGITPQQVGPYQWSASTQGVVLASYFYLYAGAQVCGGPLAEWLGAKALFGGATLLSSLLTCLTPAVASLGPGWLTALRILLGFVHGMHYPSAYALLSRWSPVKERGTHLSCCVVGTHSGIVLATALTGYLSEEMGQGGWKVAFYALGSAGFVWFVLWMFLVFDSPAQHPRISEHELHYIQRNRPCVANDKKRTVPWAKVLLSPPVWAAAVAKFCGAWSFLCFQTKLPAYLNEVLHMSMKKNGYVNALLFSALCISMIVSGKCSDLLRSRTNIRITTIRKTFETVALVGPAACLLAVPFAGCDAGAVVTLLVSSMALFGLCGGGDVSVVVDMAPAFAGKIFGVVNAFASIPGILAPIAAGHFLDGHSGDAQQWTYIFCMSIGLYLFGSIVFLVFGSAETQSWGTNDEGSTKGANILWTVPIIDTLDAEKKGHV